MSLYYRTCVSEHLHYKTKHLALASLGHPYHQVKTDLPELSVVSPVKIYQSRVSFETSFDSKQPGTGAETSFSTIWNKTFVSVISVPRFFTETENFGVSIEPKQTEEQSKKCDR